MKAQIIPEGEHAAPKGKSPVAQFFLNIETMVQQGNKQETVVYFTMLFSLFIWVIAFLSLFFSVLFYVFFLWHYVPRADGSLTQYCRRKIETRLERIVSKKIKKALEKQDAKRKKEEREAMKNGGEGPRMPTLPKLGGIDDDTSSVFSGVTRSDTISTTTTLPSYSSNPPSRTNTMNTMGTMRTAAMKPTLPVLDERPGPIRSDTQGTTTSFGSNAPLLGQAGDMGTASPAPPMPPLGPNADYFGGGHGPRGPPSNIPPRSFSAMSQGRASPAPRNMLPPVDTSFGGRDLPASRVLSPPGYGNRTVSPPYGDDDYYNRRPAIPPVGGPTFSPYDQQGPAMGPSYEMSPVDVNAADDYVSPGHADDYQAPQLPQALRTGSPAQTLQQGPPRVGTAPPPRSGTAPPSNPRAGLPATLQSAIQRREAMQPMSNRMPVQQQQRSVTAPLGQPRWDPEFNGDPMPRSHTTTPGPGPQGYNPY